MKRKVLVAGLILGTLLFAGCGKTGQTTPPGPTPRVRKPDVNLNQEPLANRPFVTLTPRLDGHAITMKLLTLKKASTDLEYEIEYNSGALLQGAFGEVALDPTKLPIIKEILLGSCSSGGKCTYNEDVSGGTLTLRFGNPDFSLKNEWSLASVAKSNQVFTSRDGRFTFETSSSPLKSGDVLIFQSPGYPGNLDSPPLVGPYSVGLNSTYAGQPQVSVRVASDVTSATLMGYDGQKWKELSSKLTSEHQLSFTGSLMQAYVVIKK